MKVVICDDQPEFIQLIAKMVKPYAPELKAYLSGDHLMSMGESFDIAFLDVQMPKVSGFEVARHLHAINKNCILVFFSAYPEFATRGYEFNAFRYVLKQEPIHCIQRQIEAAFQEYSQRNQILTIVYRGSLSYVPMTNIMYFESSGHNTAVYATDGKYPSYIRLKDIENELSFFPFVRCHKSYILNLAYLKRIEQNGYRLYNGTLLPGGRNYRKPIEKALLNFKMNGGF